MLILHLSMKVSFLIAITSAKRVGEIGAFMAHSPYTILFRDKVTMRLNQRLCKWISNCIHFCYEQNKMKAPPSPKNTFHEGDGDLCQLFQQCTPGRHLQSSNMDI